jgi:hypothetical protein
MGVIRLIASYYTLTLFYSPEYQIHKIVTL